MLYFVCGYPKKSQKMIGLKGLCVGLILSFHIGENPFRKKLVLHQIWNQIYNIFLIFSYLYFLNVSGMVWLLWRVEK